MDALEFMSGKNHYQELQEIIFDNESYEEYDQSKDPEKLSKGQRVLKFLGLPVDLEYNGLFGDSESF